MTEKPIKLVFVGDSTVGKTSLIERLVKDRFFENTSSTIGAAFMAHTAGAGAGENLKKQTYHIWDTAGQERFNALIPLYVSNASIIVLMYDISVRRTFQRIIDHWIPYVKQNLRLRDGMPKPMMYLVGNKLDLSKRAVSPTEQQDLAAIHKMEYLEVSAKNGQGAKELFGMISTCADRLLAQAEPHQPSHSSDSSRSSLIDLYSSTTSRYCCWGY